MKPMHKLLSASAAVLLAAPAVWAPAFAQGSPPQQQQQQNAKPARNPNQIVCERQTEIGSRLATTKVCKTRAQWAEDQRADRMTIEKVQIDRDLNPGH
jgi:invasion protein IalB